MNNKTISGFSKLSKRGKLKWIVENFFKDPEYTMKELQSYWHGNEDQQKVIDGFSENTISNFILPYGVAPNFIIDGKEYVVPMVIEESSVVAAASSAAKFWASRGGFKTTILGTTKIGQIHFLWRGDKNKLIAALPSIKARMLKDSLDIVSNMVKRGGGVVDIILKDMTDKEPDYYKFTVSFETCDSMGANFINSCLESFSKSFCEWCMEADDFTDVEKDVTILMSILSNFTPDCLVKAEVSCPVEDLGIIDDLPPEVFAEKFAKAIRIAHIDPYRATTHNKGIFNGIDAVVIATANDFRAIEAAGHTYASLSGSYTSLSHCTIENGIFKFWLVVPLAVGTVGGLTALHPIAKFSLELLGYPSAKELMSIISSAGLAQNFAAIKSLVTTGIQKGHMKMHLQNMLTQLKATDEQVLAATEYFKDKVVSFASLREFLQSPHEA
ncbi:MAG: hydroxymethylglutaryl-CoA reductase, degradative [Saprospiraceae bacterium]|nr:hydroxymethylglutaryl-CoA reductase, degradative [Saprospiraceae bacterium]